MANEEYSERGFALCNEAIQMCPGYYSAWHYRRELVDRLKISPLAEIKFLNEISLKNPKNYQIWSYRREIIELIDRFEGELEFLEKIFNMDSKNIHAWGYRQWLVTKFGLWDVDREYALRLIAQDPFNNSAWNEKIFISRHDNTFSSLPQTLQEIDFVLSHCSEQSNECPFNYLRALYSSETETHIKNSLINLHKSKGASVNLLKLLAHFYETEENFHMQKACYAKLEQIDKRRSMFWAWKNQVASGKGQMKAVDEEILRLLTFKNVMFEYYWGKSRL